MTENNLGWDPYPGRFKVCDGRVVTVIAGLLLSTEHIIELQLPGAGAKHQEPLPCWERTAGETTLILVGFPEHWNRTEPKHPRRERERKKKSETKNVQTQKNKTLLEGWKKKQSIYVLNIFFQHITWLTVVHFHSKRKDLHPQIYAITKIPCLKPIIPWPLPNL